MMLVTGLVILLIFLTVLVSAVAQEQRVESEVGNLFEQAFVDGRSNKAVATPPDDAKIHTLHSTLMKQIRDVNGTYTATIRTLQVYTEKYRRPDLTLIVEANALTQRLSKLYAELERAWGQYLANCDPKAPNCQAAVGLRQGALQHSRQWSLGFVQSSTVPLPITVASIVVSAIALVCFCVILALGIKWRVISKTSLAMSVSLVLLIVSTAVGLASLCVMPRANAGVQTSGVSSYIAEAVLGRLSTVLELTMLLPFAWVWSGVAANMLNAERARSVICGVRIALAVAVVLISVYMVVFAVLTGMAWMLSSIPSGYDYSLLAGAIGQLVICTCLLGLCLFVYRRIEKQAQKPLMLAFQRVLVAEGLLWVSSVLILVTAIRNAFFPGQDYWESLVATLLLYTAMVIVFFSYFQCMHRDGEGSPQGVEKEEDPSNAALLRTSRELTHSDQYEMGRYEY